MPSAYVIIVHRRNRYTVRIVCITALM